MMRPRDITAPTLSGRVGRTATGLTTIELLIAIVITSLTGMAVATITTAVARGMTSINEDRGALQRAHALHARLRAYTDVGLCVLQTDEDRGFALWLHDDHANSKVNLLELRVFWFEQNDATIILERVQFPETWTSQEVDAADRSVSIIEDFFDAMSQQRALGMTTSLRLSDSTSSFTMTGNSADIVGSNRFHADIETIATPQANPQTVFFALGMPNHTAPQ